VAHGCKQREFVPIRVGDEKCDAAWADGFKSMCMGSGFSKQGGEIYFQFEGIDSKFPIRRAIIVDSPK